MIPAYSTTIRRKEMDAVLTCMVDEKIGPGELNGRLIQVVKEFTGCDGAVALRSPAIALRYALQAMGMESGSKIMISALAPVWQYKVLKALSFEPIVLDVSESSGLVTPEVVQAGILEGGKLLVLHETEGILPDMAGIAALNIPVIEDISQSAGAFFTQGEEAQGNQENAVRNAAGSCGVFTIMGLEERDVITAGGGAVLMAPKRREWIVLKKHIDEAPSTDLLPDINAALAWVQVKEFAKNEKTRKEIYNLYQHSCMIGRHKLLSRDMDDGSTMCCFPLVLASSYKDVKQYAAKKDIEVRPAFENSVIAFYDELSEKCIHAKSLYLRCVHFPLYPRLTHNESAKIAKVLGSLP